MRRALSRDSLARAPAPEATTPALLTATSWAPPRELAIGDWFQQGCWLGAVGRASGWWIGDWVRYGTARYGDRYAKAAQLTGYDVQSLMNMAYVAGRFTASRRRPQLSFSHHAELASLDEDDQDLWLDRAQAGRLSVRSLRAELRAVRRKRRSAPAAPHPDVATGNPLALELPELICPECGHRFDAAAPGRVEDRGSASSFHPRDPGDRPPGREAGLGHALRSSPQAAGRRPSGSAPRSHRLRAR